MPIKLNGATSGSVELEVPAAVTGGDVSLSLPGAGTVDRLERAGNILQVKQTHLTTRFSVSYSADTATAVTGLNVSITPSSTANKILVFARMSCEFNTTSHHENIFGLSRNGTNIGLTSDSVGSRRVGLANLTYGFHGIDATSTQDSVSFNYLDSPSLTSSLTYQVYFNIGSGSNCYVNRTLNDGDSSSHEWLTSSITAMEVAG